MTAPEKERKKKIHTAINHLVLVVLDITHTGLELARVPGTRRNSGHHFWHPRILSFLILIGTRRAHSIQQVAPSISNS